MPEPRIVDATVLYAECGTLDSILPPLPLGKWLPVIEALLGHYSLCIEKNQGQVVKYVGPAVCALFTGDGHAERAWIAARMIVENAEIIGHGLPKTTEIHASLNSGPILTGDFGSGDSARPDVYGPAILLAESLLGGYSGLIMAGEATVDMLPESAGAEEWDLWGDTRVFNLPTRLEMEDEVDGYY